MKKSIIITVIMAVLAIFTNAQTVQYETIHSYQYDIAVQTGYDYSVLDSLTVSVEGDLYRISGKITTVERTRTTVKSFSGLYAAKSTDGKKTVYETTGGFDRDRVEIITDGDRLFISIQTFSDPIIPLIMFTK
jgi:hypothetical protein